MSKRAKRGKAETLALPMVGRVAVGAVAVAALGYSLLSRPTSVQPIRKPSAHQAQASSTPVYVAPPVHASARVRLQFRPRRLWSKHQKPLTVPEHLFGRWLTTPATRLPGTVIIDTKNTFLYFVLNDTQAMRYGIGVGREGFTWSGEQTVARKTEWPDWRPPAEMLCVSLICRGLWQAVPATRSALGRCIWARPNIEFTAPTSPIRSGSGFRPAVSG